MIPPRPTDLAHDLLRGVIRQGDQLIDATAGNGHDTVFLAECAGAEGRVLAFDIQETAILSARAKVEAAGLAERVEFHQKSHTTMADHAGNGTVAAIMFNLGYLPGDNHRLTTTTDETLSALTTASVLLKPGGALSIICYPGHTEGETEAAVVESWASARSTDGWKIAKYAILGTLKAAPFLIIARKNTKTAG